MIRPVPARWFEVLAARDDATLALEALAATGMVELEARASAAAPAPLDAMQPLLAAFAEIAARYRAYWPQTLQTSAFPDTPVATMQRSLDTLRQWAAQAEPAIERLQAIEAERVELGLWQRVLAALSASAIDYAQLAQPGATLRKRLFVLSSGPFPDLPPSVLVRPIENGDGSASALAVGTRDAVLALEQQLAVLEGHSLAPPGWLGNAARDAAWLPARRDALKAEEAALHRTLDVLQRQYAIELALGDAYRVQWLMQNVRALESGDLFCWITGWSSDATTHRLDAALEDSTARTLLHSPKPPARAQPPLLLVNPWWARPFELFSRALGMPSRNEADASVLLALAVPLMFGYMFGDLGQGLVIALGGFLLRKRFAVARLLVAGGIAAAVFGVLFGSVFSMPLLRPLWLDPLAEPLMVLVVPLVGGAVLLLIGLLLSAAEAHWRGEFGLWLGTDAGLVLAYLAILSSHSVPAAPFIALAGALLYFGGHAWHAQRGGRATALLAAVAELIERLVQLLINTLSFARVGAFALAHAGLSSAVVVLMDASRHTIVKAAILVAGNVLILGLETMVVSVQTTRLVLFEFFTRFLSAEGRVFKPLSPPPSTRILQEI